MANAFGSSAVAADGRMHCLVLGLGSRRCALPLAYVRETMRPQRLEAMEGAPTFVLGVTILRGHPVPVVDLARLLGAQDAQQASRLVTLRLGDRTLALAVGSVVGVRALDPNGLESLPPTLGLGREGAIESIGQLDGALLVVLRAMRILPEAVWQTLLSGNAASP